MYEEKKIEFDWKGVLLKLAFLILVIILVIKLLPLNVNRSNKNNDSITSVSNTIIVLKDASLSYFNKDRLPKNIGEKIKVSLNDLIEAGIIQNLRDDNNNECNIENTYIQATRNSAEYELELYLVCADDITRSYIYLGCYGLCESTTTTKKVTTKKVTTKKSITTKQNTTKQTTITKPVTTTTITKAPTKYTVIFNVNGGNQIIDSQYILDGSVAIKPGNPVREGYIFEGWYFNDNLYDFTSQVTSNRILIAKWIKIQ